MAKFVLVNGMLVCACDCRDSGGGASVYCLSKFDSNLWSFTTTKGAIALEDELIAEVSSGQDRLANSEKVSSLVTQLEQSGKSIARPAIES